MITDLYFFLTELLFSWNLPPSQNIAKIFYYQLYSYSEVPYYSKPNYNQNIWKKIINIGALPLPMSFILTEVKNFFFYLYEDHVTYLFCFYSLTGTKNTISL